MPIADSLRAIVRPGFFLIFFRLSKRRSLIAIGEGAEALWLSKDLPGKAYRVKETADIATTLRTILSNMLGGAM